MLTPLRQLLILMIVRHDTLMLILRRFLRLLPLLFAAIFAFER